MCPSRIAGPAVPGSGEPVVPAGLGVRIVERRHLDRAVGVQAEVDHGGVDTDRGDAQRHRRRRRHHRPGDSGGSRGDAAGPAAAVGGAGAVAGSCGVAALGARGSLAAGVAAGSADGTDRSGSDGVPDPTASARMVPATSGSGLRCRGARISTRR